MLGNVLLAIIGCLILFLLWVMLYDTTHFEVTEYEIRNPKIKKACRAVVIADLHNKKYGRENQQLLDSIREGKPDFVLIAGDILTARPNADFQSAVDFIGALAAQYPIFYGMGNHEHRMELYPSVYGEMAEYYGEALSRHGVTMMENEKRILSEYGISVTGAMIDKCFFQRFVHTEMEKDYLQETLPKADTQLYQILLAHNPDYFPEYAAWGADLVLSGHVHGGVARIPFWNRGIVSPAVRFFPKYDGGLFLEGDGAMILSRGLGSHTIPFRLFNPGDLIFLDFQPGDTPEKPLKKRRNMIK